MKIQLLLKDKLQIFKELCSRHKVKYLYAFGSAVTNHFNEDSDIDLVVEIDEKDPLERGEKLISFWDEMENFFKRRVDLLTESSIKNPYLKKNIDETKILIYDGRSQKVLI
ncbi:MAG: nucleotidyltransferase family protein [Bacteroidia bacterium]